MTRRTHPTVERAPAIGDVLAHYRIVGVVSGDTRLYVAEQHGIRGISRTVSLKCIHTELAESVDFRTMFFDAARVAPRFDHPNVVTIYEMSEASSNYFVSMEYLPAESVTSLITKCNTRAYLPPDIAAHVVKQVASAVQYLHDRRAEAALPGHLGHGVIEPSNVFVTYHGTIKLFDIGLRYAPEGSVSSGVRTVDSARHAVAPRGNEPVEGVANSRTDVFSLGLLLWTCLTGRSPHAARGANENDNDDEDEDEAPVPSPRLLAPSRLRAEVPEALDAITMQALSLDPLETFPSVRALSEALDRYLVRRDSRPTHKHVRRWMEQSFGTERASLQLQIAQGRNVADALSLLSNPPRSRDGSPGAPALASQRPRELWSTSHSVFSRLERGSIVPARSFEQSPGSAPNDRSRVSSTSPRPMPSTLTVTPAWPALEPTDATAPPASPHPRWLIGALLAACALAGLGTAVLLSSSSEGSTFRAAPRRSTPSDRRGHVDVRSTPEGAAVFIDGEPTGLRTPVVLKGLDARRRLSLRVDKAGYESQTRQIEIAGGSIETQAFELHASNGLVHFVGAPAGARIYVDDVAIPVDDDSPVSLSVGPHAVRVETPSALLFSGTVVIVAGQQIIRTDGAGATP